MIAFTLILKNCLSIWNVFELRTIWDTLDVLNTFSMMLEMKIIAKSEGRHLINFSRKIFSEHFELRFRRQLQFIQNLFTHHTTYVLPSF